MRQTRETIDDGTTQVNKRRGVCGSAEREHVVWEAVSVFKKILKKIVKAKQ